MATIKLKQKKFGPVYVQYDGHGILQYGSHIDSIEETRPPTTSPVDILLASLGACIVVSIQWAASQKKQVLNPFMVEVTGVKAQSLPNRVESMNIRVGAGLLDDPETVEKIVAQAKSICTVSNTLNCEINLTIGI